MLVVEEGMRGDSPERGRRCRLLSRENLDEVRARDRWGHAHYRYYLTVLHTSVMALLISTVQEHLSFSRKLFMVPSSPLHELTFSLPAVYGRRIVHICS